LIKRAAAVTLNVIAYVSTVLCSAIQIASNYKDILDSPKAKDLLVNMLKSINAVIKVLRANTIIENTISGREIETKVP
jgi:hypothetical protein